MYASPVSGWLPISTIEPNRRDTAHLIIFQTEVIEQRFRAVVLPHHDQQASENGDPQHNKHSSLLITMLLLPF
jgi:hypothetical protein